MAWVSRLGMAGVLLLASACAKPLAAPDERDATLGTWYADASAPADTAPDATADTAPDASPDAAHDALPDLADAAAPDAITPDSATPDSAAPDSAAPDAAAPDALADAVTAADASPADVPDMADSFDAPDTPDIPDVVAGDTGPAGVCFKGAAPSGDAFVADIAPGDPAICPATPLPAAWFTTVPPATLVVTPGTLGADGTFAAYENDAWVPIIYGAQGGFHVWAGFTVGTIANATAPTLPLDVQIWADVWAEGFCVTDATGIKTKEMAAQIGDGQYSNVFAGSNGIPAQFYVPAASSAMFCGLWINLHIRVHDPASGAWGEGVRVLRLYDSKP